MLPHWWIPHCRRSKLWVPASVSAPVMAVAADCAPLLSSSRVRRSLALQRCLLVVPRPGCVSRCTAPIRRTVVLGGIGHAIGRARLRRGERNGVAVPHTFSSARWACRERSTQDVAMLASYCRVAHGGGRDSFIYTRVYATRVCAVRPARPRL